MDKTHKQDISGAIGNNRQGNVMAYHMLSKKKKKQGGGEGGGGKIIIKQTSWASDNEE